MKLEEMITVILFAFAITAICVWLGCKIFRNGVKDMAGVVNPPPLLRDIKAKFLKDGCPDDFYVPDPWFDYLITAIYTPPTKGYPEIPLRDERGPYLNFHNSRLRPQSTQG